MKRLTRYFLFTFTIAFFSFAAGFLSGIGADRAYLTYQKHKEKIEQTRKAAAAIEKAQTTTKDYYNKTAAYFSNLKKKYWTEKEPKK